MWVGVLLRATLRTGFASIRSQDGWEAFWEFCLAGGAYMGVSWLGSMCSRPIGGLAVDEQGEDFTVTMLFGDYKESH